MSDNSVSIPFEKLAAPARRALKKAGYENLKQLARIRESDVAMLHGIGPNALSVLRRELAANNLSFKE
jgi:predicted Fe-Mo cluster-binding NifX family protein